MFFANFKIQIFISIFFFVGNTHLGLPFKETINDILISSMVLPIHPTKVCRNGNLHYVALKLYILWKRGEIDPSSFPQNFLPVVRFPCLSRDKIFTPN